MICLRSIRVRLLALIGLLLLLVLSGFGYFAWHRESEARIAAVDRELQERLNLLITGFRPDAGQRLSEVSEPRLSPRARELFTNQGGDPFYYLVWLGDGRLQARSTGAPEMAMPQPYSESYALKMRDAFRELVHFTPRGRCFLVGRSIQSERAAMRSDAVSLTVVGAGVLLAGLALAWWIASRVTTPLVEVSRAAKQIAAGDLSQRIQLAETKDELGAVTQVLNETFARLEAAFSRQKQFTADASHELRTPVSLILAHAQGALMHDQSTEDYREALTDISHAAQRMKSIIETLLDLARFDADSETRHREPCDLAEQARECVKLLRPLAEAKRIQLVLDLKPAPCLGEPTRLAQVITNLLDNAIQHTQDCIRITTQHENDHSVLTIADNGLGIDPKHLLHLFDRFYRADESRHSTRHHGLGLAISKAIVDAHGGSISVTNSESGQGTTVMLTLQ